MPFTVITLGEFLDQLAARLDDPTNTFFSRAELLDYTKESLRTWAAHTGYWISRGQLTTEFLTKDYDLGEKLLDSNEVKIQERVITDRDMITSLCYALLDTPPVDWSLGWASVEQFDLALLLDATRDAINYLQQQCSLITEVTSQVADPTPIGQHDLTNSLVNLRSLYWEDPEGVQTYLSRQDQYLSTLLASGGSKPDAYSLVASQPRRVELSPIPTDAGTLFYIYTPGHTLLSPTTAATKLHIPTNYSWAAKWYALFTLLNAEGERRDKFRADYCAMRIKDSLALAKILPGVYRAYLNSVPIGISTSWDYDRAATNWRNTQGKPANLITHSWNTISLHPIPGIVAENPTAEYALTLDVAINAPIPTLESSYLDISADILQPLLDYAHHLACFKMGGQEFADSIPSYERFLRCAMGYNAKLLAESNNFYLLKEESSFPRTRKPTQKEDE
jgi:hypothetical protein